MKLNIEIDMTPEEARRVMGLPDLGPLQAVVLAEMEKRMHKALDAADPEAMVKAWMAPGLQGWEAFNRLFQEAARRNSGKDRGSDKGAAR
ncbi:MAG: DUF6489 family protein [Rhizomicrobium sp.]